MTDKELDQLCRAGQTTRDDLICHLGGYVGLRAFEIPQICPGHVSRTDDGEQYRLRVPSRKDATGNGGKPRDAYLPHHVEKVLHRYQTREGIARDEAVIGLTERGGRASSALPTAPPSRLVTMTSGTSPRTIALSHTRRSPATGV